MANIESPMAGKVWKILVKAGDSIAEDDEVIILEALKMENPVFAPEDGVIKEILVKEGQQVSEGDVLAVIE